MTITFKSYGKHRKSWNLAGLLSLCSTVVCLSACGGSTSMPTNETSSMQKPLVNSSAPNDASAGLSNPNKKEIAMQLVSSAENSSLNWRAQYAYIEDIEDDRGYTGGTIGFTSATGDMLEVVRIFTDRMPDNPLAKFLPALVAVNGSASHEGLGDEFVDAWKSAAEISVFRDVQDFVRDRDYFNPSVALAQQDGLSVLGQFIYYDAAVVHGRGVDNPLTLEGIRKAAMAIALPPAMGGDETTYLNTFLDKRVIVMKSEPAHEDVSRIETAQRVFLQQGNLALLTPLYWKVYGQDFSIADQ